METHFLLPLRKFIKMGCGESKHDVATGNTITRKKSAAGEQSKNSKDIRTVPTNALLLVQQQGEGDHLGNKKNNNNEENGDQVALADHHVKDIAKNTETKEGEEKEKESLITKESPNRYFSSRNEEESIDGIEGRSEYDSPRPESGKESLFKDNEKVGDSNAVEEKKPAQETISEAENVEGVSEKKEENLAKKTEKEKEKEAAEAEASAPAFRAEKNLEIAEKEQEQSVAASPSKDLKTV